MTFVISPNGQSLLLCTHDVFHNTQRCGFGNGKTAILLCTAPPDFNPIMYCSTCGSRMKSKGPRIKQINHSILQDGFKLVLAVSVRKWHCDVCGAYDHDHFTFVEDRKRNSNLVPLISYNTVIVKTWPPGGLLRGVRANVGPRLFLFTSYCSIVLIHEDVCKM